MNSRVWVVVLTWNGRDDTLDLLGTLDGVDATVLVVDNDSADGTLEAVARRFPAVRRLQTGANLGYAGGNNAGIKHALDAGAEMIVVLNNDTLASPGFLDPLVEALRTHPDAAVSPDIRYAGDPDVSWFRGSKIDRRYGWPQHLQPGEQPGADTKTIRTPLLTGCCLAARAETWRKVGLFDERMFLMFEDSDWSMRARSSGVELLVVPASRIEHKVSRSFTGAASLLGSYYFARNGAVFAARHLGRRLLYGFVVQQVLRGALRDLVRGSNRPAAVLALTGLVAAATRRRGPAGSVARRLAAGGNPDGRSGLTIGAD